MRGFFRSQSERENRKINKLLEKGKAALEAERFADSFSYYSQAAGLKSPEGQYHVGLAYLQGLSVPANLKEGALWLEAAANGGCAEAQFIVATLYMQGLPELVEVTGIDILNYDHVQHEEIVPDMQKAAYWAQKAAEQGSADAQALYGYMLSSGPEEIRDVEAALEWYDKAVAQECVQGYLGKGLLLLQRGNNADDYAKAAVYLEKAAEGNMGSAIYRLGVMYETGQGVPRNLERAVELYHKAAEMGIREAQALYGISLRMGKGGLEPNLVQAETWLRRAALQGDIEAAVILGDMNGRGNDDMPPSYIEAARWYRFAAEKGHAGAARALGMLYLGGLGVAQSLEEGVSWLEKAAEHGDGAVIAHLGNLTLQYPGLVTLDNLINERLRPAAEKGDQLAAFNLAVCLLRAKAGEENQRHPERESEARQWMKIAMEKVVNARFWYGRMLMEGLGGEQDKTEGRRYIREAAENHMVDAQNMWATMLMEGDTDDGKANPQEALKYYQEAANKNHVSSMFSLGALYGGGNQIPVDRVKAQKWFSRAAQEGHAMAQLMLGHYLAHGLAGDINFEEAKKWLLKAKEAGIEKAEADLAFLELDEESRQKKKEETVQPMSINYTVKSSEPSHDWKNYSSEDKKNEDLERVEVAPGLFFVKNS